MNTMRRIMNRSMRSPAATQDNSLGLMHLRKLYVELCCTLQPLTQKEQEDKLYMMLPLFCKVFENSAGHEMMDKFGDVLQFANHVARLFVTEVRRRASDQSTEAASRSIAEYLEIRSTAESSNGWMLLTTLNLLAGGGQSIVNTMMMAALPSTLVKCLYLFFDLPEIPKEEEEKKEEGGGELTPTKRRELLHKYVVQLLVKLCNYPAPADELAKKDDLTLLFSAITSWCPPHNSPWRKGAAEVLTTISRHGLTQDVVQYIHNKGCLALCVDNMQQVQELTPLEKVEMCFTVFCFLKDSSDKSRVLLDEFRSCQGYIFLADFVLKLESMGDQESIDSLRNLVLLISSLTQCGYNELRPNSAVYEAPFQLPGFTLPQPSGIGNSVRNLQAFQVLQTIFLKANTIQLCGVILEVITNIYNSDNANYFILEPQHTLSQFIDRATTKSPDIQLKIFELLEFVVFNLNFVPYKELISVSLLIKAGSAIDCLIRAIKCLLRILRHSVVYKDVYREVGLLEVMVTCLHRYAASLKDNLPDNKEDICSVPEVDIPEQDQNLAFLVMDCLTLLLHENGDNATVFRECGGARCSHNLVPYIQCRQHALAIVQQLVLSRDGEDDMGTLLGLMNSTPPNQLQLKTDILQSLLNVLRDSHRSRTVFRKVGGFVYVTTVLVSMEGSLSEYLKSPWDTASREQIFTFIHVMFQTLAAAMRQEPANAKFFASEIRYESLTDDIRRLGCLSDATELLPHSHFQSVTNDGSSSTLPFHNLFDIDGSQEGIPDILKSACLLLRCLYDTAIDAFSSKSAQTPINSPASSHHVHDSFPPLPTPPSSPLNPHSTRLSPRPSRGPPPHVSSPLTPHAPPPPNHPTIVHPGAVLTMLDLMPSLQCEKNRKLALRLQMHIADVIQDLVKSERNQQVMCENGLPQRLLHLASAALADEEHPLHGNLQHMLERLASQALEPKDLRDFLRLGCPLNCKPLDDCPNSSSQSTYLDVPLSAITPILTPDQPGYATSPDFSDTNSAISELSTKCLCNLCTTQGNVVPLTRVKCLVSMTTPRDVRLNSTSVTPAFVEFDMSAEGFGCLYLPSIAPQSTPSQTVVNVGIAATADSANISGVGTGERPFPPQSGLTYSIWFCVDRYCASEAKSHQVRLLTLVRNVISTDNHSTCLRISIAGPDRKLVINTAEESLSKTDDKPNNDPSAVRVFCPELAQEGKWHHLGVVFNKAVLKNSSVSLYVDGTHIHSHKMPYIQTHAPGASGSPTNPTSVYAYIGTPPSQRSSSRLLWRLGPTHLFEDALTPPTLCAIYLLGPTNVGSFQAPRTEDFSPVKIDLTALQIQEEKIVIGIHAHALSVLTISKIRKTFNKFDSKSVAKQLGLSTHENSTPIRILHNSACHLSGSGRSLGAVLIGNIGVRTFGPKPVASTLENIGGSAPLLGLIAMSTDVEGLYAAVKALVCVVKNNGPAMAEMERTKGYQILAFLLKKKKHLLNSHILHLTFSLVGTIDSGRETTIIPHRMAFEDLLADLEVWHNAPYDLQRSLYDHFYELLTDSSEAEKNRKMMRQLRMVNRLLFMLHDPTLTHATIQSIANLLSVMLQGGSSSLDLLLVGQFIASTLPSLSIDERMVTMDELQCLISDTDSQKGSRDNESMSEDWSGLVSPHNIHLRNVLLDVILKLLFVPNTHNVNPSICEEVQKVLGYDWLLLVIQSHVHATTVIMGLRILVTMLHNQSAISKFRDGSYGGGWLDHTEAVLQNRMGVVLGFNLGKGKKGLQNREINQETCHMPGFTVLQWLLPKHASVPGIYFLLMAMSLGQHVRELPENCQLDLNSMWQFIFGVPTTQSLAGRVSTNICTDAILVILATIRAMLNHNIDPDESIPWIQEYPVTLIQFLLYLYHNVPEFKPVCMSAPFLCGLAATLFPYIANTEQPSEDNSELSSPSDEIKYLPGLDIPFSGIKSPDRYPGQSGNLTFHPARRYVMDFLRVIVMDSLSLSVPSKTPPVLDLLLEASPVRSTPMQTNEFQTEVLANLMDRLVAGDVLLERESALPIAAGGSFNNLINNVFYISSRVVDKLWQGVFNHKSKEVFEFVAQLIGQAKRRGSHGIPWDTIYHCMNRTVLYQLSRPHNTVAGLCDQFSLLESLHQITENRIMLFGSSNSEQEFIACLCHLLFSLTDEFSTGGMCLHCQSTDLNRTTQWHVDPMFPGGHSEGDCHEHENAHAQEGQLLVRKASRRVWDDLVTSKKQFIEEIFKVTLPNSNAGTKNGVSVDLKIARSSMGESASKTWNNYITAEKKTSQREQQALSRLSSKVSNSFQLLSSSRKSKRESASFKYNLPSIQEASMWTFTHISIARDLVEHQYNQHQQSQQHLQRYITEEWSQMEMELTRERGLWGPPCGSELDKWILDMTEGPSRMRKKVLRNDMFYDNYPHREDFDTLENKPSKGRKPISFDSRKYWLRQRVRSLLVRGEGPVTDPLTEPGIDTDISMDGVEEEAGTREGLRPSSLVTKQLGNSRQDKEWEDSETPDLETPVDKPEEPKTDNQMILRLLEEGEKIRHMFRCARIQGLDTSEGLLLFCKEHFYVVDGFTLLSSREICDIDAVPAQHQDPIIPRASRGQRSSQKRTCSKFAYEDIREVHKRRYLLQPSAIEVFSADGRNYLLAFPRKVKNKVYARFVAEATRLTDDASSVAGQKRNVQVEGGNSFLGLGNLIGEKTVTQRWERGEITNFHYLMALNTIAGRSYNDLMQYPVFPWILADYDSEELRLDKSSTFRDLSKPLGAQTEERLMQFKKRYDEWEDPTAFSPKHIEAGSHRDFQGETPPYYYGTHYSSAMIVASTLVRMEPFTQHFLRLQGGHFDLADRMFHSIKDAWLSASKHNMADVKELLPEFFYLPEFMTNHNNFDLGIKQSGIELGDVILPPWAKGDPREFIRMHREALECDYVSAHLHEWIDLIFGYKQQGKEAAEAHNVFHHLFYEGNVDIYSIDDPLKKNATIGFINNFGQIPKQLFKKPHPQKKVSNKIGDVSGSVIPINRLFFHNLDTLRPSLQPLKELKGPVGQIIPSEKILLAVEQNKVLIPPVYNRFLAFGYADLSLRIGSYDSDKATTVFEGTLSGQIQCAVCPNTRMVVTGGASTVVHVWQLEARKERSKQLYLKQALYGHNDVVTCLAVSTAYNIIISGSKDQTCLMWDLNRLIFVRQLRDLGAPVSAVAINNLTGDIATCAGAFLYLWSINGELVASVNTSTGRDQRILCCAMSEMVEWDSQNVIMTGSSDGVVRMWSVEYVQVPDISSSKRSSTSNSLQPDDTLVSKVKDEDCTSESQSEDSQSFSSALNEESEVSTPTKGSVDKVMSDSSPDDMNEVLMMSDAGGYDCDTLKANRNSKVSVDEMDGHNPRLTPPSSLPVEGTYIDNRPGITLTQPGDTTMTTPDNLDSCSDATSFTTGDDVSDIINGNQGDETDSLGSGLRVGENGVTPPSPMQRGEYVILSESDFDKYDDDFKKRERMSASHRNKLKPGFKWQRQLVFRSKLTMHTAFERKDNVQPAAVTALAISRDHMKVFVGDERGRVFSWSVADQPGKVMTDHWVKDESSDTCASCSVKFTFAERRHHCRNCGKLFCSRCSRFESEIQRLRITKPVRVCQACYNTLKAPADPPFRT
ncbi:WD repeat and FYVE domain-containing protein 3-like isoform X3 [Asterias amurensis]|uniref:WD repeat and FYVE domain-containing protein 3-like isoform X3 n=1 Tax=Asterias amurensis TaxID=7602 RepID=UPI003AB42958